MVVSFSTNSEQFSGCRQLLIRFHRTSGWLSSKITNFSRAFFLFLKSKQQTFRAC